MSLQKLSPIINISEKASFNILRLLIVSYIISFFAISFLKFDSFAYFDYDLAYFNQIVWNILHGSIYSSIIGLVFLGVHVQLIWFLIAPLYALAPHPLTLLFLQSLALGLGAYPLYLLGKKILGHKWALLISFLYLFYPALGHMNLFEFHSTAFATLFLLFMLYYFHNDRFGLFMLFLTLSVFCQENITLVAFGMGIYALLKRKKPKWIVLPIAVFGIYFWFCLTKIMPYFNENTIQFNFLYNHLGKSVSDIVINIFRYPIQFINLIFEKHKVIYLIQLFGPLSFIPLLSPLSLLIALPLFAQHLLSSRATQVMIYYHYTAEIIPFIFLAFIFAIKNLQRLRWFKRKQFIFGIWLLVVSIGFNLYLGPHFRLFQQAVKVFNKDDCDLQKELFLSKIPKGAPVVATFEFLSHLPHRKELYSFHHQYTGYYTLSKRPYRLPDTVRYALLDFNDRLTFRSFYSLENYKNIQRLLNNSNWAVTEVKDTIVLFEKDVESKYVLYSIVPKRPRPNNTSSTIVNRDIKLLGYDLRESKDNFIHIIFYWQSLNQTQNDINVFFDFIDERNKVAHRSIRPICYRIFPTNAWQPGQFISEEVYLSVPSYLLSGRYSLAMGFFDYATRKIYKANPSDNSGRINITTIEIDNQ
ncbi:MAG: DUF2079 domain-containing protein [Candidatus Omnitrophota bacterium]